MWQRTKNIYHLLVASLANLYYFFPSRRMKVIAVTGTDGKTTTVNLIYHILERSGCKVSMISSINAVINGETFDVGLHVTTPSPFLLQRMLRRARKGFSDYFVLEATSHAIDQNRIYGIPIKIAVLTNVSNEHLDYHKTYDKYLQTKLELLKKAEIGIVNRDDRSYEVLSNLGKLNKNWKTYGLSEKSDYNDCTLDPKSCNLFGDFNKYNTLAAIAVAKELGLSNKQIEEALKSFKTPIGREEYVYKKDFSIMVDFAHTPNAFEQLLKDLRKITKGRIIHVFGSAGERDRSKRPEMGKASAKYADLIILTSEDPRSEDVNEINSQIATGISKNKQVLKISDRTKAIEEAIRLAKKGDLILLTGKAHESSMNYGSGEKPWNEFEVVKQLLIKQKLS